MDLTLSYRGNKWIAHNDKMSFSGTTLDDLDDKIKTFVVKSGLLKNKNMYKVKMYFNNAEIPAWIRQYAQHYFNRVLIIKARREDENDGFIKP